MSPNPNKARLNSRQDHSVMLWSAVESGCFSVFNAKHFHLSIQMAIVYRPRWALPLIDTCNSRSTHTVTSCSILPLDCQEAIEFFFPQNVSCFWVSRLFYSQLRGWGFYRLPTLGFPCLRSTWMPLLREKTQWALTDKSWKGSVLFCVTFSVGCRTKLYCLTKQSSSSQTLWKTDRLRCFFSYF